MVFSGGQTSALAGPISEGQSYWSLAEARGELIPDAEDGKSLTDRMIVEEFARDSYENLIFSIARFKEYTSNYPSNITVVGLEFKKSRFENLHRAAIKYPANQFRYVGINPAKLSDKAVDGENVNAGIPFSKDPHGCWNRILVSKRRDRNPFRRSHPYTFSCPELYNLLTICNRRNNIPEEIYENLPWSHHSTKLTATVDDENIPNASFVPTPPTDATEDIPNVSFEPPTPTDVKV